MTTECCGAVIAGRFCPKCGWEARVKNMTDAEKTQQAIAEFERWLQQHTMLAITGYKHAILSGVPNCIAQRCLPRMKIEFK